MELEKHSFLSNLFGNDIYEKYRPHSMLISIIGTIIIAILFLLSKLVYWKFVSFFVNLFFGYSLIFILYVVSIIRILDVRILCPAARADPAYGGGTREVVRREVGIKCSIFPGYTPPQPIYFTT